MSRIPKATVKMPRKMPQPARLLTSLVRLLPRFDDVDIKTPPSLLCQRSNLERQKQGRNFSLDSVRQATRPHLALVPEIAPEDVRASQWRATKLPDAG